MITEKELDEKYSIPNDVRQLYSDGVKARDEGNNGFALDVFLRVLKEYPEHPKVLNAVAWMHRREGRFSEAGFLGSRYKPFATGGDPAKQPFAVEGVVAPGITRARQAARRDLLHNLDTLGRTLGDNPTLKSLRHCEEQAYDLILGDAGKLFDLYICKKSGRPEDFKVSLQKLQAEIVPLL